jgi:Ca-activated chloride channel homolog
MTRIARKLEISLLLWVAAGSDLFAQFAMREPIGPSAEFSRPQAHIRADKNLVLVPVSVVDQNERPVVGLQRSDFRVFDNRTEQSIESLSMDDAPLAVGIVFDTSGSMSRKLRRSRMAVKAFLDLANPEDEFLLVEFNDRPTLSVPFTNDPLQIESRLSGAESRGNTALLDAISFGLVQIKKSATSRKALLLISDGGDNHSRYRAKELARVISESDVSIYALGIYNSAATLEERAGPNLLRWLAEQTGGREYSVDERELPDIAAKIGIQLRNQYVLGFSPGSESRDGRYHALQVKVRPPRLPHLAASWRLGYYAESAQSSW